MRVAWLVAGCLLLWPTLTCTGRAPSAAPASPSAQTFALPRTVEVDLAPYDSVASALADADLIDWRADLDRAAAITLATAALELQEHLRRAGIDVQVAVNQPSEGPAIALVLDEQGITTSAGARIDHEPLGAQGYAITPDDGRVWVSAPSRVGVLYGSFRLLEALGFDWPSPDHAVVPSLSGERLVEWPAVRELPNVARRGFWIYGDQLLDDEYVWWMARNRLNVGGRARPALGARLGVLCWQGGHELVQQEFSRPGLFDEHPDWFALIDGTRRPIEATGAYFNPAFGVPGAAAYFAERMLERLVDGDLADVDVLNIWPADDRFNAFDQSERARQVGNETDNLLHLYVVLCRALREAWREGRLNRPVTVAGISYFLTMQPPTNEALIDELATADYLHVFYPIERDWSGAIDEALADRDKNRELLAALEEWRARAPFSFGVVEYYNVSTFGAVALTHAQHLAHDYEVLTAGRSGLFAWMHPLADNPGPRGLTNALVAKLAWRNLEGRPHAAAEHITGEWFTERFGEVGSAWREVHELMASSVDNAQQLFGIDSLSWVVLQEQLWAEPPYTRAQADAFIERYRVGGVQLLPGGYSARAGFRSTFRGLDDSIALLQQAERRWLEVVGQVADESVGARLAHDLEWFIATAARYRLLAAACDVLLAVDEGGRQDARARMERELALLTESAVLDDTISPVDQRAFLEQYRTLLGAP